MLMRNSCRSWTKLGIAPAALLVAACVQLQPHPATSQTDARSTEATARPVPSADDDQSENPWLVLGTALERRVAVDRDGDGLGRRLVDLVAMEEYHRQTAEKYRVGREKNASSVDPRILAQMQVAERQHREAAARWMEQADAVAAQVRASGEDPIGRSSVDGARLDSEACCGVWAESSATEDRALVGRFCEGLHQAATVRFAELDELPSACVAPALADGGSAVIAMRCQSAPAPAGTPTFVNNAEGKVVRGSTEEGGRSIRVAITVAVRPTRPAESIEFTAFREEHDDGYSQVFVTLGAATDAAYALGRKSFACNDLQLWRAEKWRATESTKGNGRYTTVLDATYLGSERTTVGSLPRDALMEYARSTRAGGSYCGLEFELTEVQREQLRAFADASFSQ